MAMTASLKSHMSTEVSMGFLYLDMNTRYDIHTDSSILGT